MRMGLGWGWLLGAGVVLSLTACPEPPAATCNGPGDCLADFECQDGVCVERATASSSGNVTGSSMNNASSGASQGGSSAAGQSSSRVSSGTNSSTTASSTTATSTAGSSSTTTSAAGSSSAGATSQPLGSSSVAGSSSAPVSSSLAGGSSSGVVQSSSLAPSSSAGASSSSGAPPVVVTTLGTDTGTATVQSITLTAAVPAGQLVVVVAAGGDNATSVTVTDSGSNTWYTAVRESGGDTNDCYTGIHYMLPQATLPVGATVTATFNNTSANNAIWAFTATGVTMPDQQNGTQRTTNPTVTTTGAVTSALGLVVGVSVTGDITANTFSAPAGFTNALAWDTSRSSGIMGYRFSTTLTGTQAFGPTTSNGSNEYLSSVAVFRPGTAAAPSSPGVNHTANADAFTASWSAGAGNGGVDGCVLQWQTGASTWSTLRNVNCDVNTAAQAADLPPSGWVAAWSSINTRVVRRYDLRNPVVFPQALTCTPMAPAGSPTPSVDEDCDGLWDDVSCTSYTWVNTQTLAAPNSACLNDEAVANRACDSSILGDNRYTDGVGTTTPPDMGMSYGSANTVCTGNDMGAVRWNCQGTGCDYH